jgi:hypothetical protein
VCFMYGAEARTLQGAKAQQVSAACGTAKRLAEEY